MVDRVIEIKGDDELVALKNVTINEPYFQGTIQGDVMPGVLQIEAMAQAAAFSYFDACKPMKTRSPSS